MAPPIRFAPAGIPLHIRCRGNQQQDIFLDDQDRLAYIRLLSRHAIESNVSIIGYCLMANHVHLVLQPNVDDAVSRMMNRINSEHGQGVQRRAGRIGHLWQGRYKASAMDDRYLWTALRYVERNPVRSGLTERAHNWQWSSASAHSDLAHWPEFLAHQPWSDRWTSASWSEYLETDTAPEADALLRRYTRENRPFADPISVRHWENSYGLKLLPERAGRPKRKSAGLEDSRPAALKASTG